MRRHVFLLFLVFGLAACAPRASLIFAPGLTADLPTREVFVATSRVFDGKAFGSGRAQGLTYLRFDISIPPQREAGAIPTSRREVDPNTQFLVQGSTVYPDDTAFRNRIRTALNARRGGAREVIVYVHGFNNTFDEGILRLAQLAEDFGVGGVPVHYSWPSAGQVFAYAYDRDSVLFARDGLNKLITEVKAAGAENIIIVGHSVGSHLVMEVLRERAIARPGSVAQEIDGVILISPDIDVQLFKAQARRIGDLPDPFGIFVSRRDRALALSARLTGQRDRLGNATASELSDIEVTLVDVTEFSKGAGHFTIGDAPALLRIFGNAGSFEAAFRGDSAGRAGLLPGTVLTVQNATEIILSPVTALAR